MTEIEKLRAEVEALKADVAMLRGGLAVHHYHHAPSPSLQSYPHLGQLYYANGIGDQAISIGHVPVAGGFAQSAY